MADGSIRIGTKLDTSQLKKDIKQLERELARVRQEQAKADEASSKIKRSFADEREIDSLFEDKYSHREDIDSREADALREISAEQEELNRKEQEYTQLLDNAKAKLSEQEALIAAQKQVNDEVKSDKSIGKIKNQSDYNSELDKTISKMATIEAAAERVALNNGLSKEEILNSNPAYQKLNDTLGTLQAKASDFRDESTNAGYKTAEAMSKAEKSVEKVGDATHRGMTRFAKMQRAMFGIMFAMRAISSATQEYMAVNSSLEGQLNTLRALFGQILGPAIQWVINLLVQAISAVNAFVYSLTGINFVAKANAAALQKQAKASGGGGSSNQTAGFDEQTKLSGGGSSGASGGAVATLPDGTTLDLSFLDPLKEALKKFYDDISPLLSTLKDIGGWLFDNILVPLADYAANGLIPAFLNVLGAAALVLNDALLILQPAAQWLWDNLLEPIAEWTGGIILDVINAIGDWIREHQETLSWLVAIIGGITAAIWGITTVLPLLGSLIGALFSPVTLIIGVVAGLIYLFVEMYDSCEGFRSGMQKVAEGFTKIWEGLCKFVEALGALFRGDIETCKKLLSEAGKKFVEGGKAIWEGLLKGLKAGWEWIREQLTAIWKKVSNAFCEFFGIHSPSTLFSNFGKSMMDGLVNGIKAALSRVISACKDIWEAIKGVFRSVGSWFKNTFSDAWQKVKDVFSKGGKIFDGIKEGIANTFKTIVNGLIGGINKVISVPFNAINGMLNTIRGISVLGVSPFKGLWSHNPLAVPQIPKLALGGIVNRPGRGVPAIIGEAGAEAVLPLDRNTEWMDILAEKINGGGNIVIPIYLNGKKIHEYIVDMNRRKAFATNGG